MRTCVAFCSKLLLGLTVLFTLLFAAGSVNASTNGRSTAAQWRDAPLASTPANPNCNGCTFGRTASVDLSWSTTGTSANVHVRGGPGIDMNPGANGCCNISLGSQWPGNYTWTVTAHGGGDATGPDWNFKVKPYPPSNLSASAAGSSQINLNWTKSTDDPGSVDSYNVYMNGSLKKNVGSGSTSTDVGGLSPSTTYSFYLKAVRQGVESDQSNTASATTQQQCYSLNTTVSPSGAGSVSKSGGNCPYDSSRYTSGSAVTVTANASSGYVFSNWTGDAAGSSNPTTVYMTGDKNVTANFTVPCYSLSLNVSPAIGGSVSKNPAPNCATDGTKYTSGTQVTLTANGNAGYVFSNWTGDATGTTNPTTVVMTDNKSVTANFSLPCYSLTTVALPTASGTLNASPGPNCNGTQYTSGMQVTLTANASSGYRFSSWSGDASGTTNPTQILMDANKNVTGNFTPAPPVLLIINPAMKTVNVGESFDLAVQVQAGSQQVEGAAAYLNFDASLLKVTNLAAASSLPTVITSNYDNTLGHVDFAAGQLGTPLPSGTFTVVTVTFQALATVASPGSSVTFNGTMPRLADVTYNGASVLTGTTPASIIIQNVLCYTLTMSVIPAGSGTVTANPTPNCNGATQYASGTQVTLTPAANSGYRFKNWSGDLTGSSNPGALTMDSAKNVTANFEVPPPVLLAINPSTKTVNVNENFDLTVEVQAGTQHVDGAAGYLNFDAGRLQVVSLTAGSSLPTIIASNFDNTQGHVDFAAGKLGAPYPAGTFTMVTVTFKALATTTGVQVLFNADMPRMSDVTSNGASVITGRTPGTVIVQNVPCYTLTTSVSPASSGTVTPNPTPNCNGATQYTSGTQVTLTANPASDYQFVNWTGDAIGATSPVIVAMNANKNVTANFAPVSAVLNGSVTLQGRPPTPDARWITPLRVTLTIPGQASPAYVFTPITNNMGQFSVGSITPGTYDIRVKNSHSLQNKLPGANLVSGTNNINFGTLLEGDANDDNYVTVLDFSVLSASFSKCQGTAGFDSRADFNVDSCITILDFSLLASNFGKVGQNLPAKAGPPQIMGEGRGPSTPGERGATTSPIKSARLTLSPATTKVKPGQVFTLIVRVAAGTQGLDAAQASLDYNPKVLRVRRIIPGSRLPLVLLNRFDNTLGTLDFAAGTLSGNPKGTFELLKVEFEALGPLAHTSVSFHGNGLRDSDVSLRGRSVLKYANSSDVTVR